MPGVVCRCGGVIIDRVCSKCGPLDKQKPKRKKYAHHHFYQTQRWRRASILYLHQHPICEICNNATADLTDHIEPHNGNYDLFWNPDNWQSACHGCHNRKTADDKRQAKATDTG